MRSRRTIGEIQVQEENLDDYADAAPAWKRFAQVYADIRPLSGREQLEARQMQAIVTHRIETEYVAGVNAQMRFRTLEGRVFDIQAAINVNELNRRLELLCTERG